jgi:hypothetical protein
VPGSIPWHSSQTKFPRYQKPFHENGFTRITTKWLSPRVWSTRTSCYALPDVPIPSTNWLIRLLLDLADKVRLFITRTRISRSFGTL